MNKSIEISKLKKPVIITKTSNFDLVGMLFKMILFSSFNEYS